uniref:SURP motif domain-containing protein n=1 Tax=Graphocephala atropunctata TaxID=36148 RepID=A0A1B6KTN7_9HEMI
MTMKNDNPNCDLSIIGYTSKVYRNDDRASEIDAGKHLIHWMGTDDLQIDRYDVRNYFNDPSQFEAECRDYRLSKEDEQIEEMCDKERYRALLYDEQEEELYKEEEEKRTKQSHSKVREYSQVSYQYNETQRHVLKYGMIPPHQTIEDTKSLEKASVASKSYSRNVPPNIAVPGSDKVIEIIDKTADCVAKHGRQMEVLIKTRQAQNEIFNFLTVGSDLNPYYEHVLEAIKSGYYKIERQELHKNNDCDHATVLFNVQSAPNVPDANYTLTDNCPYNMLVNKIHQIEKN